MNFRVAAFQVGLLTLPLYAAVPQEEGAKIQLTARIEPAKAAPASAAALIVDVSVPAGWHTYGSREQQFGQPVQLTVTEPGGLEVAGPAQIPPGFPHTDVGITTYWLTGKFTLKQPLRIPAGLATGEIEVAARVDWTLCDDSLCLPPDSTTVRAKLVVESGVANANSGEGGAASKLAFDARAEPARVAPGGLVRFTVRTTVEPGWHVYGANEKEFGTPIRLSLAPGSDLIAEGDGATPAGEPVTDAGITTWHLSDTFDLVLHARVPADAAPGTSRAKLQVDYTACDDSHCLPQDSATLPVAFEVAADGGSAAPPAAGPPVPPESGVLPPASAPGAADGLAGLVLLAFFAGLITLLMPCTYPMIPITFSFFTKQADARGGRVLPLALTYGAGIVLIFVLIGVFFGGIIVPFAQHPLTNLVIGLLFFLFAFALFGLVDLQPPRFLLNFAGKASTRGGVGGVFLMGATLVVTSFTCTAPFVGTLLGAASASLGHVILGMAVFGLTMAIPFVWLALAPGWIKALPRSGEWMHTIKVFLGFLELAAALKFFSNVDLVYHAPDLWLPRELFLMLWAGIFLVAGLYLLGAFRLRDESQDGIGPGRMTFALATLLFACYCAYGALGYRLDAHVMTPIAPQFSAPLVGRAAANGGEPPAQAAGHEIVADDYDAAKSRAAATNRLLLINFTGVT